jgi:hypothetical protein
VNLIDIEKINGVVATEARGGTTELSEKMKYVVVGKV